MYHQCVHGLCIYEIGDIIKEKNSFNEFMLAKRERCKCDLLDEM